ncbi:MAG: ribonuclease [Polaromonas sp.]|nr:ribonuclease [Polaromonas sp.]
MYFSRFYQLAKKSVNAWIDDYAPSMGAAISYYTVFSIAPLLIIVIAVAGFVWGREAVQGELVGQMSGMIGEEGAKGVQSLIESANQPTKGIVATLISIVVLVIGATTVFAELQSSLDRIWQVPQGPKISGIWATLRSRLLSLGFILGLGFLLMVSLVTSAGVAALGGWAGGLLPGWEILLRLINIVLSVGVATVLFAMIFKVMPQAKVSWHDVWIGAAVTAVLFEIGKSLISLYIGKSSVTSSFAAAGSLVVLLVWVYYSAQIFLLGAEFTWVYANDHGSLAKDKQDAALPGAVNANAETSASAAPGTIPGNKAEPAPVQPPPQAPALVQPRALQLQAFPPDDAPAPMPYGDGSGHPTLKQRAIVYGSSAAALLALRLLLKRRGRNQFPFPSP